MTDGQADSGIVFDIADLSSLLAGSDVVELEEPSATTGQSAPQYHELKSRVVVGRWVFSLNGGVTSVWDRLRPSTSLSLSTTYD